MRPRSAVLLSAILLALFACGGEDEVRVEYAPHTVLAVPVEADADGAPDIADPQPIRVGGTWYLYATQSKRDLNTWSSRDLREWRAEGPVWSPTPGSWNAKGQVWAPHVEVTPDGFFLYYTADMQIGVARADSPLGPFVEVYDHPLVGGGHGGVGDGVFVYDPGEGAYDRFAAFLTDFEEYAIDAFVLRPAGRASVFYYTSYLPLSTIHGRELKDWTTLADAPAVPLVGPGEPWEGFVAEGVTVIEHGGRFTMLYSGNSGESVDYAVGVATAGDPLGPFAKDAANPFLKADPDAAFYGPGHQGVVEGAFGDLLMFYHTKVSADPGFDRRIRYAPLTFDDAGRVALGVPAP
jgi:beta-xylosidase